MKVLYGLDSDFADLQEAMYVLTEHWKPKMKEGRRATVREAFRHLLEENREGLELIEEEPGGGKE